MKKYIIIIIIIFLSCNTSDKVIHEMFDKITVDIGESRVNDFSSQEEKLGVGNLYMTYGIEFRNKYLRSGNKNNTIVKYFNDKGVYDIHSMSYIIFSSLHRELNGKPLNIDKQIETFNEYQKEDMNCKILNERRGREYFNSFERKDTIIFRMQVRQGNAIENLCIENDKSDWVFDDSKDLIIKGILEDKIDSLLLFKVRIVDLNRDNIKILKKEVNRDDIVDFDLKYNIIVNE